MKYAPALSLLQLLLLNCKRKEKGKKKTSVSEEWERNERERGWSKKALLPSLFSASSVHQSKIPKIVNN